MFKLNTAEEEFRRKATPNYTIPNDRVTKSHVESIVEDERLAVVVLRSFREWKRQSSIPNVRTIVVSLEPHYLAIHATDKFGLSLLCSMRVPNDPWDSDLADRAVSKILDVTPKVVSDRADFKDEIRKLLSKLRERLEEKQKRTNKLVYPRYLQLLAALGITFLSTGLVAAFSMLAIEWRSFFSLPVWSMAAGMLMMSFVSSRASLLKRRA